MGSPIGPDGQGDQCPVVQPSGDTDVRLDGEATEQGSFLLQL